MNSPPLPRPHAPWLLCPLAPPLPGSPAQTDVGCDDQNYQTCTERSERVAQLGDLIKELIPDVQVIHQGEDVDKRNYRVSFAKIHKHLGFTPRHTVADGITSTGSVQAWRSKPPSKMAASPTTATPATATTRPSVRRTTPTSFAIPA